MPGWQEEAKWPAGWKVKQCSLKMEQMTMHEVAWYGSW